MGRPSAGAAGSVLAVAAAAGAVFAFLTADGCASPPARSVDAVAERPARVDVAALLRGVDPRRAALDQRLQRLVVDVGPGVRATLTLDATLQESVQQYLAQNEVAFAALVALDPSTGRVLAYVSYSAANPGAGDLARDPTPPAASVFKIITAAALVDAGVGGETRYCYGGGFRRLAEADLIDDPARDRMCATLSEALGGSINAVFAKLAVGHLDDSTLTRYARAFGFGEPLPFDLDTVPSPLEIPSSADARLEFARSAAGFWHSHMSPLHGALLAATLATGGVMPRPAIVDEAWTTEGQTLYRHVPSTQRRAVSESTARAVSAMMEHTVTDGTSERAFHDGAGRPYLPGVRIAAKTGSLSAVDPYRGYTWWTGFAPADQPRIALAALVVNTPLWRIKASDLAAHTLRTYFAGSLPSRQ